jgi:aryl-alcohol dehydrogenase-like predicted oxidoreductase
MVQVAQRFIAGIPIFPVGLGGASWKITEPAARSGNRLPDDELAIQTIHAALDSGITLIDTARAYTTVTHPGYSEALIARALATHPAGSRILVATKGGHYRSGDEFPIDGTRETIRRHCEVSRELLGLQCIDLYLLHWPDPNIPIRSTMATFAELQDEGLIRHVGVSNVSLTQLQEATSVVSIASVQNRFSPFDQSDRAMVDYCAEHSIAYLAYSPLRGPQPPSGGATRLDEAFPAAAKLAQHREVSIQRIALAWLLSLSPTIIPICGASRPESIRDSALAATDLLADDEIAELDFGRRTEYISELTRLQTRSANPFRYG